VVTTLSPTDVLGKISEIEMTHLETLNTDLSVHEGDTWDIQYEYPKVTLGQRVIIRHNGKGSKHTVLVCLWKAHQMDNPPIFYVDKFDLPLSLRKKSKKICDIRFENHSSNSSLYEIM
jgi:hypothetical protein